MFPGDYFGKFVIFQHLTSNQCPGVGFNNSLKSESSGALRCNWRLHPWEVTVAADIRAILQRHMPGRSQRGVSVLCKGHRLDLLRVQRKTLPCEKHMKLKFSG